MKYQFHDIDPNGGNTCRHFECVAKNASFPCAPYLAAEREKIAQAELREAAEAAMRAEGAISQ